MDYPFCQCHSKDLANRYVTVLFDEMKARENLIQQNL